MQVEYRLLGPLEALIDGRPVELGGARQRAVLAVLLLRANEVVPVDRLIDEVWGDDPPETVRKVLQSYISQLRKVIGTDAIRTRGRGYVLELNFEQLDLLRFQRLASEAERGPAAAAVEPLRAALGLWRGPPLAELSGAGFTRAAASRLEELRILAVERLIEAELELGRAAALIPQLDELVEQNPRRERLRALLMLALYRSGRQADALEAFRTARQLLIDELGIEPGPALQELQRAVLSQDQSLGPIAPVGARGERVGGVILVAPRAQAHVRGLCSIAEPLARQPARELIIACVLGDGIDPGASTAHLAEVRDDLVRGGLATRVVAYSSPDPGADVAQLAVEQQVDLVLIDAPHQLLGSGRPDPALGAVLRDAPCDVAIVVRPADLRRPASGPVVVPFGGTDHDWSAVELAGWTARALGTTLRLVGTSADRFRGRRDASRLLGRVSLVVQAVIGIVAEPVLVRPGATGVLGAATDAALLVIGFSDRWQAEGLGHTRLEVAREATVPTLLVRRGLRPGGLAPNESVTRFTWTLGGG